jgi:hypothetical protein
VGTATITLAAKHLGLLRRRRYAAIIAKFWRST